MDVSDERIAQDVQAAVGRAAQLLTQGDLVAFPTETVYGLGADARSAQAVAKIFVLKGRPADHPLIVHLARVDDFSAWSAQHGTLVDRLIERFWPGPLTLIVRAHDEVRGAVTGYQSSVGLRMPAHPLAQALLTAFAGTRYGTGVAAPSANRFGRVSPTTAEHVRAEFGSAVMVLDGGACGVGIESTILDLSRYEEQGPQVLRPGAVTALMLAEVLGDRPGGKGSRAPRVSGSLAAHYAPRTLMRLVQPDALIDPPPDVAVWSHSLLHVPTGSSHEPRLWRAAPQSAAEYAHELYATLRLLDASGARELWIEVPPQSAAWEGINDRLGRAVAGSGSAGP